MKFAIIRFPGTWSDRDCYHVLHNVMEQQADILWHRETDLSGYDAVVLPGGFSYGDYLRTGAIAKFSPIMDAVMKFAKKGKPVIGICNGFQVLVKTDLLPGPLAGAGGQTCTLVENDCGHFVDHWVRLERKGSKCLWTRGIDRVIELPIAHGEGKFLAGSEAVRQALWNADQVALTYVDDSPNGSTDRIAGVCDASGLVFGLMPHPERYVDPLQHYAWTSRDQQPEEGDGLQIFRNAAEYVGGAVAAR
jgi:phosphoribosylformylglycinamidine synthase